MSRDATTIQAEIDDVRAAISAVIRGGKNYTINSGGSSRTVTQADMKDLRSWLTALTQELAEVEDTSDTKGFLMGANW